MIRGLYSAASGMIAESIRTDATANNLANANTAGYKKDVAVNKDFASLLIQRINDGPQQPVIGTMGMGIVVDEIRPIQTTGIMRATGNDLDVAIDGKGFFAIETANGVRYTRNGTFTLNANGELVTQEGQRVLGQNGGAIRINGGKVQITEDGSVLVNNAPVGRLQIVDFADERVLTKEGASLFNAGTAQPEQAAGTVKQGFLEQSNVNVVSEMVNLIAGYRAYEVNAKTVQAHDQLLDKAVNEVGRL